jgi:hypothetical protein
MRKLLVAALSILGLGFFSAIPDQAQAQVMTWKTSGQQSGSYIRTVIRSSTVNGIEQPTIIQQASGSFIKEYPQTTFSSPIANWNLSGFSQFSSNISNFGGSQWRLRR